MTLSYISIHTLRNIQLLQQSLSSRFHLISGNNGTGKTTFLEAIYLLSCGRSFRTRESTPLIQYGYDSCTVFGKNSQQDTISIQKNIRGETKAQINQQPCLRSSQLAQLIPCQLFYQDIFQVIHAGPAVRRNLLDWGLFHVEQSYHHLWKRYKDVLKQRNALLKQKQSQSYLQPWNILLDQLSQSIHSLREEYFHTWHARFKTYLPKLTSAPCSLVYYKGWDKRNTGKTLQLLLTEQYEMDIHRQYTHSGPHQADVFFETPFMASKQALSRGQQKIILLASLLAQAQLLQKPCIYLLDDICAEIDNRHLTNIFTFLMEIPGQFFYHHIGSPQD